MNSFLPFSAAPRRVARRVFWIAACLAAMLSAGPAAAGDDVWITLGADAFASASSLFVSGAEGRPLPRLSEAKGVVLTRVPRSGLDALSARLHGDFRRCGGFIAHESLEEGLAELARVSSASLTAGGAGFTIDQPQWVQQVAGAVEEAQIFNTMTALSTGFANRYHAHASGTAAVNWIRDLWIGYAAGRPGVTVELVTHPNTPQRSVVLKIPGTTLANEVVILGGHLDSIAPGTSNPNFSAPGADDDASGIATISEAARVLLASDFQPQRTLHIIGYAAEEVGLRGSTHLAATYQAAGVNVVAVLQQDLTDYHGSDEDVAFLTDFTNVNLTAFLVNLLETYQPDLAWTTTACGYACSDHAPWFNRGYPTSFAAEARVGEDNPWIHTTSDTVATLGNSAAHAVKFARLAAAFLVEAGHDGLPSNELFSDGFETGNTAAWSRTGG
jgi:bacterial leucyl aminopeptidase